MDVGVTIRTADIVINMNRLGMLFSGIPMAETAVDRLHGNFTFGMFLQIPDITVTTGAGVGSMDGCRKGPGIYFIMTFKTLVDRNTFQADIFRIGLFGQRLFTDSSSENECDNQQ